MAARLDTDMLVIEGGAALRSILAAETSQPVTHGPSPNGHDGLVIDHKLARHAEH